MKTIPVSVLVHADSGGCDCTCGGISSKYATLYLEHKDGDVKNAPKKKTLKLVRNKLLGGPYVFAVPIDCGDDYPMFGGNYIISSEARFPEQYPIPIHDRIEK